MLFSMNKNIIPKLNSVIDTHKSKKMCQDAALYFPPLLNYELFNVKKREKYPVFFLNT